MCMISFSGLLVGCGNPDPMVVYISTADDFTSYYNQRFPNKKIVLENWMGKQYADVISYTLTDDITISTPLKNEVTKSYEDKLSYGTYTEEEARGYSERSNNIVIDGNNHTVSGLSFSGYYAGFLGYSYGSVTIKNITFDNMTVNGFGRIGGLIGIAKGTVNLENVHITNSTITGTEDNPTGGFIGLSSKASGYIKNCSIENTTINGASSEDVGGFVGKISSTDGKHIVLSDNESLNNVITGTLNVGGHIGQFYQEYENENNRLIEFKNLTNTSSVLASDRRAGGIMGFLSYWDKNNYTFTNCKNEFNTDTTKIIKSNNNSAGGILGSTDWNGSAFRVPSGSQIHFNSCSNDMSVEGKDYVGGITGYLDDKFWDVSYQDCQNKHNGSIYGASKIGGIAGTIEGSILGGSQFTFTNAQNKGFVQGNGEYAAGICGYNANLNPLFTSCSNESQNNILTGSKYVGGISSAYGTFVNCSNSMKIKHNGPVQESWEYVGGIVGYGKNSTFTGCTNSADIIDHTNTTGVTAKYIGGIAGYTNQLMLNDCTNSGDITGSDCVGGLVGKSDATWGISPKNTLTDCSNTGNIYAIGTSTTTLEQYTNDDPNDIPGKIGLMIGSLYTGTLIFDFTGSTVAGDIYVIGDSNYIGAWCGYLAEGDEETLYNEVRDITLDYTIYVSELVSDISKTNFLYGEKVFEDLITGFNHPTSVESFTYSAQN